MSRFAQPHRLPDSHRELMLLHRFQEVAQTIIAEGLKGVLFMSSNEDHRDVVGRITERIEDQAIAQFDIGNDKVDVLMIGEKARPSSTDDNKPTTS